MGGGGGRWGEVVVGGWQGSRSGELGGPRLGNPGSATKRNNSMRENTLFIHKLMSDNWNSNVTLTEN